MIGGQSGKPLTNKELLAKAVRVVGSKAALARRIATSPQSLSEWEGRRRMPRWARAEVERVVYGQSGAPLNPIPGFSYAAAGEGVETDDMEYPKGGAEFYVERLPSNRDPDSFSLRARGESMQPFVPPGWAVVVDTRGTPVASDLVVAKIARDGGGYVVVVKRYRGRERRDGRVMIVLESANPYSADIVVPPDRILEIWPVLYTVAPRGQREPHAIDGPDSSGGSDE